MSHTRTGSGRRGYTQSTEREPDESLAVLSETADNLERLIRDALEGDKDAQRVFNQRILPLVLKVLRGCGLNVVPSQ